MLLLLPAIRHARCHFTVGCDDTPPRLTASLAVPNRLFCRSLFAVLDIGFVAHYPAVPAVFNWLFCRPLSAVYASLNRLFLHSLYAVPATVSSTGCVSSSRGGLRLPPWSF